MFSRFLKGYVVLQVYGLGKEKLINLCGKRSILVWNIQIEEANLVVSISWKDYEAFLALLTQTATEAVLVEQHGLPFLLMHIKRKYMLLFGLLFGLTLMSILQCFIWQLEIHDEEQVTREELELFLLEEGYGLPCYVGRIHCKELADKLRSAFAPFTWVSVSKTGCKLVIQVKEQEEIAKESFAQKEYPVEQRLVAKQKGKIVSMITRVGTPQKKEQDLVEVGEVLVSGDVTIPNQDETIKTIHHYRPDADVLIEHREEYRFTIPDKKMTKRYGEEKTYRWFSLFGKEFSLLPLLNQEKHQEIVKIVSHQNRMFWWNQIFSYGTYQVKPYGFVMVPYTDLERNQLITEKTEAYMERLAEKNATIKEKNVTIQKNEKKWDILVHFLLWSKQ